MISEKKMQIVIDNYFKSECNVDTSIRDAFEKGFRIGVQKTADRPKGEWIIRDDMPKLDNTYSIECSECGQLMFGHYNADNPNFCCNCGARMKGGAE